VSHDPARPCHIAVLRDCSYNHLGPSCNSTTDSEHGLKTLAGQVFHAAWTFAHALHVTFAATGRKGMNP
jgi:hypothetical protein